MTDKNNDLGYLSSNPYFKSQPTFEGIYLKYTNNTMP